MPLEYNVKKRRLLDLGLFFATSGEGLKKEALDKRLMSRTKKTRRFVIKDGPIRTLLGRAEAKAVGFTVSQEGQ